MATKRGQSTEPAGVHNHTFAIAIATGMRQKLDPTKLAHTEIEAALFERKRMRRSDLSPVL